MERINGLDKMVKAHQHEAKRQPVATRHAKQVEQDMIGEQQHKHSQGQNTPLPPKQQVTVAEVDAERQQVGQAQGKLGVPKQQMAVFHPQAIEDVEVGKSLPEGNDVDEAPIDVVVEGQALVVGERSRSGLVAHEDHGTDRQQTKNPPRPRNLQTLFHHLSTIGRSILQSQPTKGIKISFAPKMGIAAGRRSQASFMASFPTSRHSPKGQFRQ